MKNLAKLKIIDANAPDGMKAFWAFDKAAMAAGGIPVKYEELMALAVAFTTQCPYCIAIHRTRRAQPELRIRKFPRRWSLPPHFAPAQRSRTARTP